MNLYATKKTAAEGMLDIALFLANITHMKTVIEQGAGYRYNLCLLKEGRIQNSTKNKKNIFFYIDVFLFCLFRFHAPTDFCMAIFIVAAKKKKKFLLHPQVLHCCSDADFLLTGSSNGGWSPDHHHW